MTDAIVLAKTLKVSYVAGAGAAAGAATAAEIVMPATAIGTGIIVGGVVSAAAAVTIIVVVATHGKSTVSP